MVPHWVRGEETAALVEFPGMAEGTTQKIVLTALGPSVATPPEGITAEVVAVKDFNELHALGREKVAGKIVVFNHPFDQQMAAVGKGLDAYGKRRHLPLHRPERRRADGCGGGAGAFGGRGQLPVAAHGRHPLRARRAEGARRRRRRRGRRPACLARRAGSGEDAPRAHPADAAGRAELQRHRRPEGQRTSRAGRHRFRAPGFVGPGYGGD